MSRLTKLLLSNDQRPKENPELRELRSSFKHAHARTERLEHELRRINAEMRKLVEGGK